MTATTTEPWVELRRSTVCDGWGVFAVRDIPTRTDVTSYVGWMATGKLEDPEDVSYALALSKDRSLVGERDPSRLCSDGLAQMANDAIHEEITGRDNNCRFKIKGDRVHLRTLRRVAKDEELLVNYHIDYWLGRADEFDGTLGEWLQCHREVATAMKHVGLTMESYEDCWLASDDEGMFRYRVSAKAAEATCTCDTVREIHVRLRLGGHMSFECSDCNTRLYTGLLAQRCITALY